jgi:hypothetical protein
MCGCRARAPVVRSSVMTVAQTQSRPVSALRAPVAKLPTTTTVSTRQPLPLQRPQRSAPFHAAIPTVLSVDQRTLIQRVIDTLVHQSKALPTRRT